MTANQILIIAIGVFFIVVGVSYLIQVRKTKHKTIREKWVPIILIALGLGASLYPIIQQDFNFSFTNTSMKKSSNLLGPAAYQGEIPPDPDQYEEASKWYVKGAGLWRMEINGFDSTEKAMIYLQKSIELFPTPDAHTALGQLNTQLGQVQVALSEYDKALELNPAFGNAYFNRGTAHFIMGNKLMACEDWKKAEEYKVSNAKEIIQMYCN